MEPIGKCNRCNFDLEGGHSERSILENGKYKLLEKICFLCSDWEYIEEYEKTKELSSKITLLATLAEGYITGRYDMKDHIRSEYQFIYRLKGKTLLEAYNATKEIGNKIREFEEKQWLPIHKKYWNGTKNRGHSVKLNKNVKALMWGSAGRVLITLQDKTSDVTMIFTDEETQKTPNGGLQGVHGTKEQALKLINTAIDTKFKFSRDDEVSCF